MQTGSAKGAFRFAGLDPGSYSLVANTPDGHIAVQAVELYAGERLEDQELAVEPGQRCASSLWASEPPCAAP